MAQPANKSPHLVEELETAFQVKISRRWDNLIGNHMSLYLKLMYPYLATTDE